MKYVALLKYKDGNYEIMHFDANDYTTVLRTAYTLTFNGSDLIALGALDAGSSTKYNYLRPVKVTTATQLNWNGWTSFVGSE